MIRSKDVLFHKIDDCFRVTCHKPTTSLSHKHVITDTDLFPGTITPDYTRRKDRWEVLPM